MQIQGVFFCDVDGTLLPYGKQAISEDFFATVLAAKEQGFLTVISSGRSYSSLYPLFLPIRDEVIFSASNGGQILEHETDLLPQKLLEREDIPPLTEDLFAAGADPIITTASGHYLYRNYIEHELTLRYVNRPTTHLYESLDEVENPAFQITGLCRSPIEEVLSYMRKRWGEQYYLSTSGRQMFDINPTHKGESLVAIREHLDIARERTWAFGDNENDLQMLKAAGTAYLMEDADPALFHPSFLRTGDVSSTIRAIIAAHQDD